MVTDLTNEQLAEIFEKSIEDKKAKDFLYYYFEPQEHFEQFCQFTLPNAFTCEFADFHKELTKKLFSDENTADALPRNHGKSTFVGQGFVIHNILYETKRYIVYTSQNHKKSVAFLEPITKELKNNRVIKHIWGTQKLSKAKDNDSGRDREDCFDVRGKVRIEAVSFEKNIRGMKYGNYRPDLMIFDDIEDDQRVINPELRRKDSDKLDKEIIPAMSLNGSYKFIGTILHLNSLLIKKIQLHGGNILKACKFSETEKIMFKGRELPKIIPGSILFPQMITENFLYSQLYEMGSTSFSSEYLNNPIDDTASLIKREWVRACFDETISFYEVDKYDFKVQGVDFAFSDRVGADKSAFLGIGKRDTGYTVLHCETKKGYTTTQQFDLIEYYTGIYNFDDNALEENSIRSMSNELKKDPDTGKKRWNFPFTLFWTGANDGPAKKQLDKEFDGKRHTIGKIAMIKRLATQFENKNIRIPYKTDKDKEIANLIMDECCTYALSDGKLVEVGVHGDIPIALGLAIERAEMEVFDVEMGVLEI